MEDHAERWGRRAAEMQRRGERSREEFARGRERGCRNRRRPRVEACGAKAFVVECACGAIVAAEKCGQRELCRRCRVAALADFRDRALEAFEYHLDRRPGWRLTLVTFSVWHSGSIATDRWRALKGWRALRKHWHKLWGQIPFALVGEVTAGRAGDGHHHFHAVAVMPDRFDWQRAHRIYRAATDGLGLQLNFSVRPKRGGSRNYSARGLTGYLSKYVSKGINLRDFTPELAAHVVAALYQQRRVTTSHGFYLRPREGRCGRCGDRYCKVDHWHHVAGVEVTSTGGEVVANDQGRRLRRDVGAAGDRGGGEERGPPLE